MIGRFRGRAALNLDLLKSAAAQMPGGTGAEMERQYFGELLSETPQETGGVLVRLRALPATLRALRISREAAMRMLARTSLGQCAPRAMRLDATPATMTTDSTTDDQNTTILPVTRYSAGTSSPSTTVAWIT